MAAPPMATPPRIHLYAELLQNIRQVSVSASFTFAGDTSPSLFAAAVWAEVLSDGVTLCVRAAAGAEEKTLLTLPGRVAAGGSRLPVSQGRPGPGGNGGDKRTWHVSWRLPLASPSPTAGAAAPTEDNPVPWSAPDLTPGTPVLCRSCTAPLVAVGRVRAWKDLPSENWAEMMEFWHCHKPDHRDHGPEVAGKAGDAALAGRGYGANSGIVAEAGVGFVDLNAFLFAESDCQGVLFSQSTYEQASASRQSLSASETDGPLRTLRVFCSLCRAHVGYFHDRMLSVNLFKWAVMLGPETVLSRQPSVSDCLAATLTTTVARTGSSKTVVLPIDDVQKEPAAAAPEQVLHIWILNGNIRYASSQRKEQTPVPAIKLLYRHIGRREADDLLERLNSDVQETNLPRDAIQAIAAALDASNALLPSTERTFKEWKIGLLERWRP